MLSAGRTSSNKCAAVAQSPYYRGTPRRQGQMQINEINGPMDRLAIDLTGKHPRSVHGHVYILTVIDVFSRFS